MDEGMEQERKCMENDEERNISIIVGDDQLKIFE